MTFILGSWGRSSINFRDWGAVAKYFQGAEEVFFQVFKEVNTLFQGSKDPPLGSSVFEWVVLID